MLKYSRQRECIKQNLASRTDHPTAEMVYADIQKEYPNISLGTVYRNLSLLSELGEARKIASATGPDRFDGNVSLHSHFFCRKCGRVTDIWLDDQAKLNKAAAKDFGGIIEGNSLEFYGVCSDCINH